MQAAHQLDTTDPQIQTAIALSDTIIAAACAEQRIPGCSAVIVYDQTVLFAKGFGYADLAKQIPATPDTIYRIGSITKVFTGVMLMQLRDAGKLSLDDPVAHYLPQFQIASRFADPRPITLRQLASHTAGLPRDAPLEYAYHFTEEFPSIEMLLDSLKQFELCLPPLTEFRYSNLGFAILGHALAEAAQKPYQSYVKQHILLPLGMTHTDFAVTEAMQPHGATGYDFDESRDTYRLAPWQAYGMPAGMLCSSVSDMAHFITLQFRDGPAGGRQILGSSTLREMRLPVLYYPNREGGPCIGWHSWFVANHFGNNHNGGTSGFTTHLSVFSDLKLGIAIFTNSGGTPWDIARSCLETLLPVFSRVRDQQHTTARWKNVDGLHPYTGRYHLVQVTSSAGASAIGTEGFVEFTIEDARLTAQLDIRGLIAFVFTLRPFSDHVFQIDNSPFVDIFGGEFVTFELGTDQVATHVQWRDFRFAR